MTDGPDGGVTGPGDATSGSTGPGAAGPAGADGADGPAAGGARAGALDGRALAVLAMERRRHRHQGAKEQAVRDELGMSAARYHQLLNALLDDPAALAADPVLVNRLRRLRGARTADLPR